MEVSGQSDTPVAAPRRKRIALNTWQSLSELFQLNRNLTLPPKSEPRLHSYIAHICHFTDCSVLQKEKHHHHVPEGLGVFPVPWSSRWSWSLHLFLGCSMSLRPFSLYCSACFGSLFVSILCTCCSHFFWYYFISFTMFCAPVFCPIHWFFSLSSFVIPSKCLKSTVTKIKYTVTKQLHHHQTQNCHQTQLHIGILTFTCTSQQLLLVRWLWTATTRNICYHFRFLWLCIVSKVWR